MDDTAVVISAAPSAAPRMNRAPALRGASTSAPTSDVVAAHPQRREVTLDPLGSPAQAFLQGHLGLPACPLPRTTVVAQQPLDLAAGRPQPLLVGDDLDLPADDRDQRLHQIADGDLPA